MKISNIAIVSSVVGAADHVEKCKQVITETALPLHQENCGRHCEYWAEHGTAWYEKNEKPWCYDVCADITEFDNMMRCMSSYATHCVPQGYDTWLNTGVETTVQPTTPPATQSTTSTTNAPETTATTSSTTPTTNAPQSTSTTTTTPAPSVTGQIGGPDGDCAVITDAEASQQALANKRNTVVYQCRNYKSGLMTQEEALAKEAQIKSGLGELEQRFFNDVKTLPLAEIEKIVPGSASNPENVKRIEGIITEPMWRKLFPFRHNTYTYEGFLKATGTFPAYCRTYNDGRDSEGICRKLLATWFAHMVQETGYNTEGAGITSSACILYPNDNCNKDSLEFWPGAVPNPAYQGLYAIREGGHYTEEPNGYPGAYSQCGSNIFGFNYPCYEGVSYYGRGSKQLSWNYNYGAFSQDLFDDDRLLESPTQVSNTWLNLASAVWFAVNPQFPKPSMLWVIDQSWTPSAQDTANGNGYNFGTTTNIINGGIECSNTWHTGPARRAEAYKGIAEALGVAVPANEVLTCENIREFAGSDGAAKVYWSGSPGAECTLATWQTPYRVNRLGDFKRCTDFYTRAIGVQNNGTVTYKDGTQVAW